MLDKSENWGQKLENRGLILSEDLIWGRKSRNLVQIPRRFKKSSKICRKPKMGSQNKNV